MKNKGTWAVALLALASVIVAACGPVGGSGEKTIYVGPRQVDCVGVAPQKCLLVKEKPGDDWTMYYDQIQGFDYEPGYEYELRIVEEEVENPPADASSIRWTLVEVVSKTRSLEGTIWVLESYLNSEGVLVGPLPDSHATANFQDGQVDGNASCNSYFGSYELGSDGKLTIGALGMTEMYCMPDELMAQESDFLAALGRSASYLITEDNLQIEDAAGQRDSGLLGAQARAVGWPAVGVVQLYRWRDRSLRAGQHRDHGYVRRGRQVGRLFWLQQLFHHLRGVGRPVCPFPARSHPP